MENCSAPGQSQEGLQHSRDEGRTRGEATGQEDTRTKETHAAKKSKKAKKGKNKKSKAKKDEKHKKKEQEKDRVPADEEPCYQAESMREGEQKEAKAPQPHRASPCSLGLGGGRR